MNKKGFIFDLDGVIVDTAKYHFLAWKKLANSIGVDFTETQNEQLKGVSRVKSLEKILAWGNKTVSEAEFKELMDSKNTDYLNYIEQMNASEILPDVPKVLNYLIENKQGIALGSASKNATVILEKVDLLSKFDQIVDGNHVVKGKPNPEVFLKGAKALGIEPEHCIVFEDASAGIEAAKAAQMIAIGIGDKTVLGDADYVFNDFTEISTDFIKELIEK
ncbi:beta-phosphoglucomutase [Mangrovimonas sp. DI 80]|uniref:beta-phosphoglucomutase n=1 Tax=Mangrovimonas sp. DI 80 TaxID=1779330 RepID=UPI0009789894|nr:beta-phosphoglucomutase [Mangrovimonas sp. DI 80]OMP31886.1 beta-phosphoglucomutase [Mangrovimonas sp. DI 80]